MWYAFRVKVVQLAVWAIDGGVTVMGRGGDVGMVWWPLAAFWRADDVAGGHECVCFSRCDDDGCDVSQSFHFSFRGQRVSFYVSGSFTMKLAHLVHMSEDMAVVLAAHEEEHLRECGMWYGGWEVDEREHDVRSRNKLYFELKDEFFWWYVSIMRGRQGGPLCESPGCVRWADLSDVHPCDPCFCCSVCASAMKESGRMQDGPVALRTRKRKAAVEVDADMVPLFLERLVRHR